MSAVEWLEEDLDDPDLGFAGASNVVRPILMYLPEDRCFCASYGYPPSKTCHKAHDHHPPTRPFYRASDYNTEPWRKP